MKKLVLLVLALTSFSFLGAQRQLEKLDRGLVAIKISGGVYVGWRITGEEWVDATYNIYRNGTLVNSEAWEGPSNFKDTEGVAGDKYQVAAVINGVEQSLSKEVIARSTNYFDITLNVPPGGTVPDGDYTYSPNDASAADLDGDGDMEIILKWDPSNAHDNAHEGYTGDVIIDAYTLESEHLWRINLGRNIRAGAHYTQFMVADFDGDGKAEMACKTADGTTDGLGNVIGNPNADYRNTAGRVLSGPEFLTVFDGETGEALHTINYEPARGSVSQWGDSYGNRVDRFLGAVAFFDGEHPSILMTRGYYERTALAAYDFRDGQISLRWLFVADDGSPYTGQGNHNLSIGDVDNDGKDEIIYGSMTVDDDGTGLYSTRLNHGDALHVSDMDPDRPGLEVFAPHEDGENGVTFREARTGDIIWQHKLGGDVGRGVAADIIGSSRGFEAWSSSEAAAYSIQDQYAGYRPGSINFRVFWDDDVYSELLDGTSVYNYSDRIFTGALVSSNNGSKSTPCLTADLFGDWREEIIWRYSTGKKLRIYTSTDVTEHKLYTLLHDSQYRSAVSWQNAGYNQPAHQSFYMENDMALPVPLVFRGLKWQGSGSGNIWNQAASNFVNANGDIATFADGDTVIFSFGGVHEEAVVIDADLQPGLVVVASPDDYTFTGEGSLAGTMNFLKTQKGTLVLEGEHPYTGKTIISDGALILNGHIGSSEVLVSGGLWGGKNAGTEQGGRIGGSGRIDGKLVMQTRGLLMPGMAERDTLFTGGLEIKKNSVVIFDLSDLADNVNDIISVDGDLVLEDEAIFRFNLTKNGLDKEKYVLVSYTGSFSGSTENLIMEGLDGIYYEFKAENGELTLQSPETRASGDLEWTGSESNTWSLPGEQNWEMNGSAEIFLPGDNVHFNENGAGQPDIDLLNTVNPGQILVDASSDYSISGEGRISASASLVKRGTGTLELTTMNDYLGITSIEGGIMQINSFGMEGEASNLGAALANSSNLVLDGGQLNIMESGTSDRGIMINSGGGTISTDATQVISHLDGSGSLVKTGEGKLGLSGSSSHSGQVTINEGTIKFYSDEANIAGIGTGQIIINNGSIEYYDSRNTENTSNMDILVPEGGTARILMDGRMYNNDVLSGSGNLNVVLNYTRTEFEGDWSAFTGEIEVSTESYYGHMLVDNSYGYPGAHIVLNDNISALHQTGDTVIFGGLTALEGSELTDATWIIGERASESEIYGKLTGDKLIKTGTGILKIFSTNNAYPGGTLVEEGILFLGNESGSSTGTGDIIVKSGATLSGPGRIISDVFMETGSYLSPGDGIGELNVIGTVSFEEKSIYNVEVSNETGTNDVLVADRINLDKAIIYMVNNSSVEYKAGDRFTIFDADTIEGDLTAIYPKYPGDSLVWDITNFHEFGMLEVLKLLPSVEQQVADLDINVYPNPSRGMIYMEPATAANEITSVVVLDSKGAVIKNIKPAKSNGRYSLDLGDQPEGFYILSIKLGDTTITERVFLFEN